MPRNQPFLTVRDPHDSYWQSTVEHVARQHKSALAAQSTAIATGSGSASRYEAFVDSANAHTYRIHEAAQLRTGISLPLTQSPSVQAAFGAGAPTAGGTLTDCASLALRLAKAKVFGTPQEVQALHGAFDFSKCDPFWADCVAEYVAHYQPSGAAPTRPTNSEPVLSYTLPGSAAIAIFGDWGTGEPRAVDLLSQIKTFKPDVLMHLGDIYYSGTQDEVQDRFVDVISEVFGSSTPQTFSLCGNHDMYAGGGAYYSLANQIGQVSSYFAVQNDDWRFVAMDTGLNDRNPLTVNSTATFLDPSDVTWVNGSVACAGDRKVVLFSHHPPFSAYEPIMGGPVNDTLLGQVQPSLPKVAAWFWGHEHRLGIYDSYLGVTRGRCLGHGAIPVFDNSQDDQIQFNGVPVHLEGGSPLSMGTDGDLFKTGFAIMTLNGKDARVAYYRSGESSPLWEETF